jgi:predicted kinase
MTSDDLILHVPEPSLVVMIGAAGSGKTTLAARLFGPDEIVSSDELRAVISGDPGDQRATRPAFAMLHREVGRRLAAGRLVVVDATSIQRAARLALLRVAAVSGVGAAAVVLALPDEVVRARNEARVGRRVPPDVVEEHLRKVARLVGSSDRVAQETLRDEGFATVFVLRSENEVAGLRLVRGPSLDASVSRP